MDNNITITESIRSLPRDQWDALVGDDAYASYGWLLTIEESLTNGVTSSYFFIKENEKIIGAAMCCTYPKKVNMVSFDDVLFGRIKKIANFLGISFLPSMVFCPLKSYGSHLFIDSDLKPSTKEQVIEKLLDAIEAEAQRRKISFCFPRVLEQEEMLVKQLRQRNYFQTLDFPLAYMDVEWDSFDAYKKAIGKRSHNMRKNIAKEINKNRRDRVSISRLNDVGKMGKRLLELLNLNSLKYYKRLQPFRADFFNQLQKNMGDDAVIYISQIKDKITGVAVMLKKGKMGYLPMAGIDYTLARNDATFFNMLFYRPIQDAISWHINRLYLGNGKYDMKVRRGCKIQKAYIFHKSFHPVIKWAIRAWFILHHYWSQKKLIKPT